MPEPYVGPCSHGVDAITFCPAQVRPSPLEGRVCILTSGKQRDTTMSKAQDQKKEAKKKPLKTKEEKRAEKREKKASR
jgi:hypothetical protein